MSSPKTVPKEGGQTISQQERHSKILEESCLSKSEAQQEASEKSEMAQALVDNTIGRGRTQKLRAEKKTFPPK